MAVLCSRRRRNDTLGVRTVVTEKGGAQTLLSSEFMSSRHRGRPRSPSWPDPGTHTGVNSPTQSSRAKLSGEPFSRDSLGYV